MTYQEAKEKVFKAYNLKNLEYIITDAEENPSHIAWSSDKAEIDYDTIVEALIAVEILRELRKKDLK